MISKHCRIVDTGFLWEYCQRFVFINQDERLWKCVACLAEMKQLEEKDVRGKDEKIVSSFLQECQNAQ